MNTSVLTEIFSKKHKPNQVLAQFDIDLSLRDSMCTNTPQHQRNMILELWDATEGGLVFPSGRQASSIDATFDGQLPLASEHHSAIRIEKAGAVLPLVAQTDTKELARIAKELIGDHLRIVNSGTEVRNHYREATAVVYAEIKDYAIALVHSLECGGLDQARGFLQEVAQDTILQMGIEDTHKVTTGSDAIEIVPKGIDLDAPACKILPADQIELLVTQGANKATGVHNFMSLPQHTNRVPYMIGDSDPDGKAMLECEKYGGGGIWVLNANLSVPNDFADAVGGRIIQRHEATWDNIEAALEAIRAQTARVHLPSNNTSPP